MTAQGNETGEGVGPGGDKPKALGARRGRPTKLNKALMDTVCNAIRGVMHPHMACAQVGITPQAMNAWRRRGVAALELAGKGEPIPDEEKPFADFETAIHQALADLTQMLIRLNLMHARKNPITAWKLLESFDPSFKESRPGISVSSTSVSSSTSVTVGGGAALGDGGSKGQLTVEGADAVRRSVLLGGKSPTEVIRDFKRLKSGDSDTVDTEGESQ